MAKTKSEALAVRSSTDLAKMEPWEIELANKAKNEQSAEVLGIPRITHRGSILKIDDKPIVGNKLRGVIVGYSFVKKFFKDGFDPDAPAASPVCYSFAPAGPGEEAKMVPHEAAPEKVHTDCRSCPHNAFGTAEKGRGKRCSDVRRVFVIVETKDKNSILKAQVRQIEVPPGSLRNWGNFQKQCQEVTPLGIRGVLTEIGTQPLEAGAYTLTFTPVEKLTKEFVQAIVQVEERVKGDLFAPFPVITADDKPKAKPRSAKSRAKVA